MLRYGTDGKNVINLVSDKMFSGKLNKGGFAMGL